MKKSSKNLAIIGVAAFVIASINYGENAFSQTTGQKVVPPKVYYYIDVSNGGKGIMGAMANIPFMGSKNDNNEFGQAFAGLDGKHADIALLHKDFPNKISASHQIPSTLKMGKLINLIPNIPHKSNSDTMKKGEEVPIPPEYRNMDLKVSFYWGCGVKAKSAPKIFQMKGGKFSGSNYNLGNRVDPNQHQNYAETSAIWPNAKDKRNFKSDANLIGNHVISGANLPANFAFNLGGAQSFMDDLGLKSSGDKSGIITLHWNSVNGAKSYFFNAIGFANGEMVMWSSSNVPDMGNGLLNYLSNAKITQFLGEAALLPPTQTKCEIPNGIFKNMQMVMVSGIGHGEETNIIYPARPTDLKTPWIQEWAARIRNKTSNRLMVGLPTYGDMINGANQPALSPEEQARLDCEREKAKGETTGLAIGGILGGGLGGAIGGALGKSKSKCPTN